MQLAVDHSLSMFVDSVNRKKVCQFSPAQCRMSAVRARQGWARRPGDLSPTRCPTQDQFLSLAPGQVLHLDPDAVFPLSGLHQLLVRPCYLEMLEADAAYRQRTPDMQLTYITGAPGKACMHAPATLSDLCRLTGWVRLLLLPLSGSGKSCCGAIQMSQCLAQGETVILEIRDPEYARFRFQFFKLKLGGGRWEVKPEAGSWEAPFK